MAHAQNHFSLEEMERYQPPRCEDCGAPTRVVGWDLARPAGEGGRGWLRGPLRCLAADEQSESPSSHKRLDDTA